MQSPRIVSADIWNYVLNKKNYTLARFCRFVSFAFSASRVSVGLLRKTAGSGVCCMKAFFGSTLRSSKIEMGHMQVVRKLRSPRTLVQGFRWPTKLQKNMSLSKCDDIRSRILRSNASLAHTAHWPGRLARTDTSVRTSANKDVIGEDKLPHEKPMSIIDSVSLAAHGATTLERVSKPSRQITGMKKNTSRGVERAKRFTNRILQFIIGETIVPEKRIRQNLGNNPDTSKALRQ